MQTAASPSGSVNALPAHPGHALRWDARGARWWWAGQGASALYAFAPQEQATHTVRLPDGAGLLAHTRSGRLLVGLPKRLCLAEPGPASRATRLQALVAVDAAEPRTRISDGCTDRRGFLVFGTANAADDRRPIGSFYQFSRQHGLRRLALPAVSQASSICFNDDGTRMFFADAQQGRIMQCSYDAETGKVGAPAIFATLDAGMTPRGSVLDSAGALWNAQPGQLVQFGADGRALRRIAIDCGAPAFGGPQLAQLMVAGAAGLTALPAPLAAGCADTLFDEQQIA
jgi:L-arabinonolactonase